MSYVQAGLSGTVKGLLAGGACFLAVPALAPVIGTYALLRAGVEVSRNLAAEHNTGGAPPHGQSSDPASKEQQQKIAAENDQAWQSMQPVPIVGNSGNRSQSQVATA